jgi:hypothetical protein
MRTSWLPLAALLIACGGKDSKSPVSNVSDTSDTGATSSTGSSTGSGTSGTSTGEEPDCATTTDLCKGGVCVADLHPVTVELSGLINYDGAVIGSSGSGTAYTLDLIDENDVVFSHTFPGGAGIYDLMAYANTYDVLFRLSDSGTVALPTTQPILAAGSMALVGDSRLDIEPTTTRLAGQIAYDDTMIGGSYTLFLTDTESGDTSEYPLPGGSPFYEIATVEGTYDIGFRLDDLGGVTRPVTGRTPIATGVTVSGSTEYALAIQTVEVSGILGYDGESMYVVGGTPAALYFDDPETEERLTAWITIDAKRPERYSVPMYPGTFDVSFELLDFSAVAQPVGGEYQLMTSALVSVPSTTLEVTPRVHTVTGSMRYNGSYLTDVGGETWALLFRNTSNDLEFRQSFYGGEPGGYEMTLYEGTYDAYFELLNQDAVARPIPQNAIVRVAEEVRVTGATSADLGLATHSLSGVVSYDGSALQYDGDGEDWALHLFNVETEETLSYRLNAGKSNYEIAFVSGTYDVFFELLDEEGTVLHPAPGMWRAAENKMITFDDVLDLTVNSVPLDGMLSYDGLSLDGDGRSTDMNVVFRNVDLDETWSVGISGGRDSWSGRLYPGVYDIGVELVDHDAVIDPVNGGPHYLHTCVEVHL